MKNRVFVLNVVLAVVLAGLVAWNAADRWRKVSGAWPADTAEVWPRIAASLDPDEPLAVEFAAPMVAAGALGAAPEGMAVLEPAVPFTAEWTSPTRLALVPTGRLRRATEYTVHLDPKLRTLDGAALDRTSVAFATPSVALVSATAAGDDPDRDRRIVLAFDLPVRVEDVKRSLTIHDAAGAAVAFDVRALPTPDEPAFEVTLAAPDDAARERTRRVTVAVDGSLRPAAGGLPMGASAVREVAFLETLRLTDVDVGQGRIQLDFDGAVPLPEDGFVAVEPAVPFQVQRHWGGLRLVGEFRPGAAAAVVLRAGFPGTGRRRLAEDVRRSVRIPDLKPSVAFSGRGDVLSSLAEPAFGIEGVNVDEVEVSVRPVYANNLVRLAQSRDAEDAACGPATTRTIPVGAARNERWTRRVDVTDFVTDDARGMFLVTVRSKDDPWRDASRVLQLTDLGVTVRAAEESVAVRVASLARDLPVENAKVRVVTPTNQTLAEGTTDARGIAVIPCPKTAEDRVPYLVEVRHGSDRTAVDLDGFRVDLADDAFAGREAPAGPYDAWVAADRGAVRPGETVRAEIVLRNAAGRAPGTAKVEVRWTSPDRRVVRREPRTSPPSGLLVAELAVPATAPTGRWSVEVVDAARDKPVGAADFVVECFVPDRMEATAAVATAPALGGEGRLAVSGRWLDGGAAAGRPVHARIRWDFAAPRPQGMDGFSFGRCDADADTDADPPPGAMPPVAGVLDAHGDATLRFDVPTPDGGAQALRGTVRVEVEDTSGRAVRAVAETTALRDGALVGVRAGHDGATVAAVCADGTPWPDAVPVRVWLERREWSWDVEEDRHGRMRFTSRVVSSVVQEERAVVKGGRAEVAFRPATPEPWQWLVVVAEAPRGREPPADAEVAGPAPDSSQEHQRTARGAGGVADGGARAEQAASDVPRRPDRVGVSLASTAVADAVAPGDEFVLAIDAPMEGTAFVTLEGDGVRAAETAPVTPGRSFVHLRMPNPCDLPNVHAVVTVTAAQARRGARGPFWAVGGTSVAVAHPERAATVALRAPDEIRPASELTVSVDAPGATEAIVSVVDEGVLRITGHPDPDPLGRLLARRRLATRGADTGTRLLDRPVFDQGVLFGGDEDASGGGADRLDGSVGTQIATLALFTGPVALDADGRATCTFRLPSYEGRVRVSAVAAGPGVVGAAIAGVVVGAPISLLVAGPRFLAPGDRSDVTVTVRNRSGADADATLSIAAAGGLGVAPGRAATCRVHIARDGSECFAVPVVAGDASGTQSLTVTAAMGDERRTAAAEIAVRPLARFDVGRVGLAVPGAAEAAIGDGWVRGSLRVRVVVDDAPDARLLPAVAALVDYPYGCVEQTASRCVALLAGRSLLPAAEPDVGGGGASALLAVGVDRLLSMQTDRGGLAMWPGGRADSDLGTVYGLDVLLDAQAAGVRVPAAPLARLIDRAMLVLSQTGDASLRCWAVDVLSRAGRPVAGWRDRALEEATTAEDRAHVASAFARGGLRDRAAAILDGVAASGAAAATTPRERGGLLRSRLRADAVEMLARMECGPGDPRVPEIAARLQAAALRPDGLTTQEQAYAVRALSRWYAARAGDMRPGALRLVVGDRTVALREGAQEVDLGGATSVRLTGDATGFALLELRGHRTGTAAESCGIFVERRVVDADTGEAVASLRRGGVYEVRITGHVDAPAPDLLVTDILPGGLEPETPRASAADGAADARRAVTTPVAHAEFRDDRVLLFAEGTVTRDFEFRYRVRAVTPGTFAAGATTAEALYDPSVRAVVPGAGPVTVRP